MSTMKTFTETTENALKNQKWYVVDATDKVVGRLSSQIAAILRGKNSPRFTPHIDTGDFVVVINAEKIKFTGNKTQNKLYHRHTGFVGGIKTTTPAKLLEHKPEEILMTAVKGMLPKTALGRRQILKLKIYKGDVHPHIAQQPEQLSL